MLNGTLYIVTDSSSDFPAIRLITSTAVPIFNGDDEVKKREPTDKEMKIISTSQAQKLFGGGAQRMHGVNVRSHIIPLSPGPQLTALTFFSGWPTTLTNVSHLNLQCLYLGVITHPLPFSCRSLLPFRSR